MRTSPNFHIKMQMNKMLKKWKNFYKSFNNLNKEAI